MIEWHLSKSGAEIPALNGIFLASRYDPQKEALRFLTLHEKSVKKMECVFLIGAGNPYIVQELLETHFVSAVVVIDSEATLIEAMRSRFRHDLVTWKFISNFQEANALNDLRRFFLMKFKVLVAPSSQFMQPEWLRSGIDFLKGHSVPGFYFQLGLRNPGKGPTLCHVLPETSEENFGKMKALELIRKPQTTSDADSITKILSELIV
jgi:hypothetical protein